MRKSIGLILMILIVVALAFVMNAAPPPPPDPPTGGPGSGETYIGGVPIAGGLLILIALAASYGARKLYNARKRKLSE